jgi:hypothetical protein
LRNDHHQSVPLDIRRSARVLRRGCGREPRRLAGRSITDLTNPSNENGKFNATIDGVADLNITTEP